MKIGVIGVGGAVGSTFAFEFQRAGHEVFGIDKEKEIQKIREKKFFLHPFFQEKKVLKLKVFSLEEKEAFREVENCDLLFFAIPRPLKDSLFFYFQKLAQQKKELPFLFFIQNGLNLREEILRVFRLFFKKEDEKKIIRAILLNPVLKKNKEEKIIIRYSLPLKILLAAEKEEKEFFLSFGTSFSFCFFPKKEEKNLEYSKLFLNLFGMASAAFGLSLKEGLLKKEILEKEMLALKEYLWVVKKSKGKILNLPGFPLKIFSFLISFLPLKFFYFLRRIILFLVLKKRENREKSLREIDFYNGEVVRLARKLSIKAKTNEEIWRKGKEFLKILEKN